MQDCYYYYFCLSTNEYSVTVRRRIAWRFGKWNKVRHDGLEAGMPGRHSRAPGCLARRSTAMAFNTRRISVKWTDASRALPRDQCSYICSLRLVFELINVRIGKRRGTSKLLRPNRWSIRYGTWYKERVIFYGCWYVAKDMFLAFLVIAIRLDCKIPCYAFLIGVLWIKVGRCVLRCSNLLG